jgi:hypothetical protein
MKKIILLIVIPFFLFSCVDKPKDEEKYELQNITSFEIKNLPITEGYTTIARLDGEIIAKSSDSIPYFHPKFGQVTFEYVPISKPPHPEPTSYSYMSMILSFEDLTDGDDDYNDYVCKLDVTYIYKDNNYIDSIQLKVSPMANGGTLQLGFAIKCPNNYIKTFTNNVSQDFFNGASYTNTQSNQPLYTNVTTQSFTVKYKPGFAGTLRVDAADAYDIDPYIIVGGREVHVVLTKPLSSVLYNEYVSTLGRPYGLAIPPKNGSIYYRYPLEKKNIRTAYPNAFQSWLDGNSTYFDYSNPIDTNVQTLANMITLLGTLVSK